MHLSDRDRIIGGLVGVAVGDALGVPVEFRSREELDDNPVTGYRAFGTHNQPAGTWSDDTSLTLCLAEALIEGAEYQRIAEKFVAWYEKGLWTAHGKVFDIGITTLQAIRKLKDPGAPEHAGPMEESANGNGSLMRILPVAIYTAKMGLEDRRRWAFEISGFTHGHPRAKIACWFYCEIARNLLNGMAAAAAIDTAREIVETWQSAQGGNSQWSHFARCSSSIRVVARDEIRSSGYVIDTLEAALWCLIQAETFADSVLLAVNLGSDTDTVAAVTGGLAGCLYGIEGIPAEWRAGLVRYGDVLALAEKFVAICG